MKINRLVIENFKSIERIELIEPNPFTVFVGPNGSGKSTIFEGLEYFNLSYNIGGLAENLFGGKASFTNRKTKKPVNLEANLKRLTVTLSPDDDGHDYNLISKAHSADAVVGVYKEADEFYGSFSRIFIRNTALQKLQITGDQRLSLSASNLEKVLKRVLSNETLRAEIFEWLELFVPGFRAVEVDDRNELHWFEQSSADYFTKDLISDGTYNILALLTAVYQSDDQPQFLCIEEPENGLHPQVAGELVDFFRTMCEERGHYIWLNTHSVSMASRVKPEEFILVEKKQGATTTRQFRKEDFHGMRTDEAWLTNLLNGGLAW